jgi:hypothetical protein
MYLGIQEVCPIVTKFVFSRQIFIKVPNIKFHANSPRGSHGDICGLTDGWTNMRLISILRGSPNAPKTRQEEVYCNT